MGMQVFNTRRVFELSMKLVWPAVLLRRDLSVHLVYGIAGLGPVSPFLWGQCGEVTCSGVTVLQDDGLISQETLCDIRSPST